MTPRLIRPSYLLWLIPVAGLWVGAELLGPPMVIWSYSWVDDGRGHNPFNTERVYTRCTFVGFDGSAVTTYPTDGRCGWLTFPKLEGGGE